MAGLYIHIPFCRRQCYYCDFHFTVSFKQKNRMLKALQCEILQRDTELKDKVFHTVYFGGGTPSILTIRELEKLISEIYKSFKISTSPEITLEGNPDDLTKEFLDSLKQNTPVNRLSIGVQSFHDRDLHFMNRVHSSDDAIRSIENSLSAGFQNINIDLIYGIPTMSVNELESNLALFKKFNIPHLSAYHLTIEPQTVFAYFRKKGKLQEIPENESIKQYRNIMKFADEEGYEHYEISNFARPGFHSKHNLGYWTGEAYLGFGPSAHSFDGKQRRWNISNNTRYIQSIENNKPDYYEYEIIDALKAYNEYILTALRTIWGVDIHYLEQQFGQDRCSCFLQGAKKFIDSGGLIHEKNKFYLSREGKMMADYIISEMIVV